MTQEEYKRLYPWSVTLEIRKVILPGGYRSICVIYSGSYVCLSWKAPIDENRFLHSNDCRGLFIIACEEDVIN